MAKKEIIKEIKNVEDLLKNVNSLKKVFGADITIAEIIEKLKAVEDKEKNELQLKFDDLRDFLLAKLIKDMIKRNAIEEVKPVTLKVLDREDLRDVLKEYIDKIPYSHETEIEREQNTACLFCYDCIEEDAFEYLRQCIKASIDKWGLDKDINDFPKNPKDLSIENVQCKWLYNTNCDDYDCYNETGSVMELLERKYRGDDILEYATYKDMYNYMLNPYDIDKRNEVQWLEVKRTSPAPTEMQFLLLVWKYFALEK